MIKDSTIFSVYDKTNKLFYHIVVLCDNNILQYYKY